MFFLSSLVFLYFVVKISRQFPKIPPSPLRGASFPDLGSIILSSPFPCVLRGSLRLPGQDPPFLPFFLLSFSAFVVPRTLSFLRFNFFFTGLAPLQTTSSTPLFLKNPFGATSFPTPPTLQPFSGIRVGRDFLRVRCPLKVWSGHLMLLLSCS